MFTKPVVVVIYNRPEKVRTLMTVIARVRPERLFLIADGPKAGSTEDSARTQAALAEFRNSINWQCEVLEEVSSENLGCGKRISSGLDWVFSQVNEAIVLEDDCIPGPDFFEFCAKMLDEFRDDLTVGVVSGSNFLPPSPLRDADFFVSKYAHVWGWATWRRTWEKYDFNLEEWPDDRSRVFNNAPAFNAKSRRYWNLAFKGSKSGAIDTWDYQLVHMLWKYSMKSVVSLPNLVTNIGFDYEATNTLLSKNSAQSQTERPSWPLRWPISLAVDEDLDNITTESQYEISWLPFISKIIFIYLPPGFRAIVKKFLKSALKVQATR